MVLPLFVFGSTLLVAGCLQQARLSPAHQTAPVLSRPGSPGEAPASLSLPKLSPGAPRDTRTFPIPLPPPADPEVEVALGWVEAHTATTLWSGSDAQAVALTDLPQWTFLRVVGVAREGRLLVDYAGDYATRQPGVGWVDGAAIGPANDPGRWVTNHQPATLWSGTDARAVRFTDLPQWTKLRLVDGAAPDSQRVEVQFFGDGFSRAPGAAWIDRQDIGPITPPVPLPTAALPRPARQQQTFASGSEFIQFVGQAAKRSMHLTGVPASVTIAQAILESDWGQSRLTRLGNNLFGIKASGTAAQSVDVLRMATWEHLDGADVVVQAPFKVYDSLEQSIDDHGSFFHRNRRYAPALAVANDAQAFAHAIHDAGYATDPAYADKLIGLMDGYNLYRFDG
jgi:hypothetical protein